MVAAWLRAMDFEIWISLFDSENIDGNALLQLDWFDLVGIGIDMAESQEALMDAIAQLKQQLLHHLPN